MPDPEPEAAPLTRRFERPLDLIEDALHLVVALALVAVAIVVLVEAVKDLLDSNPLYPEGIINAINNALFVVIILELMRTVAARFTDGWFQLRAFLLIGTISVVRHIITIGATLSLEGTRNQSQFDHLVIELGVEAIVAFLLVIGLVLLRHAEGGRARASAGKEDEPKVTSPG
jgi:uncharacterized membrane protein (DUF373 family)